MLKTLRKLIGKWDVTPQQLVDELGKGMNDAHEWDDLTTSSIRDNDLDRLLDRLTRKVKHPELPEYREELTQVIAALRRGEIPEISD